MAVMSLPPVPDEPVDPPPVRYRKVTIQPAQLRVLVERDRNELDDAVLRNTDRPKTRGDCVDMPRPCPFVSCRHHLFLEANAAGSISFPLGEVELEDMPESCSLDVADRGGVTLEEIGAILGVTRERIRQTEAIALRRIDRRDLSLPGERQDYANSSRPHRPAP